MSDIVERLRANTHKHPGFENMKTEAAAEIERLRARVAELARRLEAAEAKTATYWRECEAWRGKLGTRVHVGIQGARCRLCERLGPDDQRQWHDNGCPIAATDAAKAMEVSHD